jgi:hypothetical protein
MGNLRLLSEPVDFARVVQCIFPLYNIVICGDRFFLMLIQGNFKENIYCIMLCIATINYNLIKIWLT